MSDETKWTKGPWVVGESSDNGIHCIDGPGSLPIEICEVWGTENDLEENGESSANAHLIAAAPELYEALDRLAGLCTGINDEGELDDALAALAKARGES